MFKKYIVLFIISCQILLAVNMGKFGFVTDGNGNYNTSGEKIYEWEHNPSGFYCYQAAGATAINIRVGKKITDENLVDKYFYTNFKNFNRNKTSSQDWLNASNKWHLKELNIRREPKNGYFSKTNFWKAVKKNIGINIPMLLSISKYDPKYESGSNYFKTISGYRSNIGHALTIVGWLDLGKKLIAVRDPAIKKTNHIYSNLFDYTIPLDLLFSGVLQTKQSGTNKGKKIAELIIFANNKNIDLKDMGYQVKVKSSIYKTNEYVAYKKYKEYIIKANRNGKLIIKLTNLKADIDLYLFDSNNKRIAYSANWNLSDEKIITNVVKNKQYFIKTFGFKAGTYTISAYIQ